MSYYFALAGEFEIHSIFDDLASILDGDPHVCEWVLGDIKTEYFPNVLAAVAAPGDEGRLRRIVENKRVETFTRCAALIALSAMYANGKIKREDHFDYLGYLLDSLAVEDDLLEWVAYECEQVYAIDTFIRINELFDDGIIIGEAIDPDEVCLRDGFTADMALEAIRERSKVDAVEMMGCWDFFKTKEETDKQTDMLISNLYRTILDEAPNEKAINNSERSAGLQETDDSGQVSDESLLENETADEAPIQVPLAPPVKVLEYGVTGKKAPTAKGVEAAQKALKQKEKAAQKPKRKIQRNDPCPCGSGKKYKNCCGK